MLLFGFGQIKRAAWTLMVNVPVAIVVPRHAVCELRLDVWCASNQVRTLPQLSDAVHRVAHSTPQRVDHAVVRVHLQTSRTPCTYPLDGFCAVFTAHRHCPRKRGAHCCTPRSYGRKRPWRDTTSCCRVASDVARTHSHNSAVCSNQKFYAATRRKQPRDKPRRRSTPAGRLSAQYVNEQWRPAQVTSTRP
jgi:hypothetical protein